MNRIDQSNTPLLSIIIPVFNTEKYLKRCLDSVLAQTYGNIEVIIVNDASPDNSRRLIDAYIQKDARISCITHTENRGLFHARLSGIKASRGDYIAHLDSDDYVSVDFYRSLMAAIQKTNADMAMGDIVDVYDDGRKAVFTLAQRDVSFDTLEGENILDRYFRPKGFNYQWHVIWNKVYTKDLWDKALVHLVRQEKHLIMTEDMVFSTVLFFYTKKITKADNNCVFYCRNNGAATATKRLGYKKQEKNIEDLTTSFSFTAQFMEENSFNQKHRDNFLTWKQRYKEGYKYNTSAMNCSLKEKARLYKKLDAFLETDAAVPDSAYFFSVKTDWNSEYEDIKRTICNPEIKVVSFDIFDTLVVRPFLRPTDLFILLDDDFRKLAGSTVADFSTLRIESEARARKAITGNRSKLEDITQDEIYETLCREYGIAKEIAEAMKRLEIGAELRFNTPRKSVFELYEMALHLGKQIICVSDMYLPKEALEKILIKNGYDKIDRIYVSSETRRGKGGSLFPFVVSDLGISPEKILHIGDNYEADFVKPKKEGLQALHYIKTQDAFFDPGISGNLGQVFSRSLPFWQDNCAALNFLGIRTMIALIANRYFDNPYRSFNRNTDFNADPALMGYGAVGMYLFGIVKWLMGNFEEKKYDKALFAARDGYLPLEAYKILKPLYGPLPREEYFYTSRKATIPLALQDKLDFYKLHELVIPWGKTPQQIVPLLREIFDIDDSKLHDLCRNKNIAMDEKFKSIGRYYDFIAICKTYFFDEKKHRDKLGKLKKYFNAIITDNTCLFDMGYSAKPEMYLSRLIGKSIDTYFVNICEDAAYKHSRLGNNKLNLFLDYVPAACGLIEELLFSKREPSCVGYDTEGDFVKPVFEEYEMSYPGQFLIETVQTQALQFIKDLVDLFKDDVHKLWIQPYYTSMLFCLLFFYPKETDKNLFACIVFEDDIAAGAKYLVTRWDQMIADRNWYPLSMLPASIRSDLRGRQKILELFYCLFFDRPLLKSTIKARFKKHKIALRFLKFAYKVMRKIRRSMI